MLIKKRSIKIWIKCEKLTFKIVNEFWFSSRSYSKGFFKGSAAPETKDKYDLNYENNCILFFFSFKKA
jgi:hypothetical protein